MLAERLGQLMVQGEVNGRAEAMATQPADPIRQGLVIVGEAPKAGITMSSQTAHRRPTMDSDP